MDRLKCRSKYFFSGPWISPSDILKLKEISSSENVFGSSCVISFNYLQDQKLRGSNLIRIKQKFEMEKLFMEGVYIFIY